jgi:hypothetical protein
MAKLSVTQESSFCRSTKFSWLSRTLVLVSLLSSCGLFEDVVPRLANEAGQESVTVDPEIETGGARSLPASISGLELEVLDVLIHEPTDDVWYILNDHSVEWAPFDSSSASPEFSAMPMVVGTYDAIEVHFGQAWVQTNGTWSPAELTADSVAIEGEIHLDADTNLTLLFDFDGAFAQNQNGAWTLTPAVAAQWN